MTIEYIRFSFDLFYFWLSILSEGFVGMEVKVALFERSEFGYVAKSSLELSKRKNSLDLFGTFCVKTKSIETIENKQVILKKTSRIFNS